MISAKQAQRGFLKTVFGKSDSYRSWGEGSKLNWRLRLKFPKKLRESSLPLDWSFNSLGSFESTSLHLQTIAAKTSLQCKPFSNKP